MTRYAAIVLAAGKASRYRAAGGSEPTKLVATHAGEPLVRRVVRAALLSKADPVLVVTGHARDAVEAALAGFPVEFIHNPDFATGLASSLQVGIGVLPTDRAGVVILLGDMPGVEPEIIDRLIQEVARNPRADAAVVSHDGQRGNPVLLSRTLFGRVASLAGDFGARKLLSEPDVCVEEVEACTGSVLIDVDEPADLRRLSEGGRV